MPVRLLVEESQSLPAPPEPGGAFCCAGGYDRGHESSVRSAHGRQHAFGRCRHRLNLFPLVRGPHKLDAASLACVDLRLVQLAFDRRRIAPSVPARNLGRIDWNVDRVRSAVVVDAYHQHSLLGTW